MNPPLPLKLFYRWPSGSTTAVMVAQVSKGGDVRFLLKDGRTEPARSMMDLKPVPVIHISQEIEQAFVEGFHKLGPGWVWI